MSSRQNAVDRRLAGVAVVRQARGAALLCVQAPPQPKTASN
jgi:hypothetical protein